MGVTARSVSFAHGRPAAVTCVPDDGGPYAAEQFCGPGYMLVGDAACLLDPLLSTGVHLALYSAINAAACIASVYRSEVTEEAANNYFEYASSGPGDQNQGTPH